MARFNMRQTVQMDYFFSHTKKHSVSQVAFLKKLELQDGVCNDYGTVRVYTFKVD